MVPRSTTILHRVPGEWAALRPCAARLPVGRESGDPAWRARLLTPVTAMPRGRFQRRHGHTAGRHPPPRSGGRWLGAPHPRTPFGA